MKEIIIFILIIIPSILYAQERKDTLLYEANKSTQRISLLYEANNSTHNISLWIEKDDGRYLVYHRKDIFTEYTDTITIVEYDHIEIRKCDEETIVITQRENSYYLMDSETEKFSYKSSPEGETFTFYLEEDEQFRNLDELLEIIIQNY